MADDPRQKIYEDIHRRGVDFEPNALMPGEPTATTGWLHVLIEEVVNLRPRLDALEGKDGTGAA